MVARPCGGLVDYDRNIVGAYPEIPVRESFRFKEDIEQAGEHCTHLLHPEHAIQ